MFKKIILLILVLLPFWYSLFFGYPMSSDREFQLQVKQLSPGVSVSRRCFGVGFFDEFTSCLKNHKRLRGVAFINSVFDKTDQISPFITYILCASFLLFIILSIFIILN